MNFVSLAQLAIFFYDILHNTRLNVYMHMDDDTKVHDNSEFTLGSKCKTWSPNTPVWTVSLASRLNPVLENGFSNEVHFWSGDP